MFDKSIFVLVVFILSGCGGGSSQEPIVISPPAIVNPDPILSVHVVNQDLCGNQIENTNVRLLIHNEDFSIKEVVSPTENGQLTYQSANKTENVSVVYLGEKNDEGSDAVNVLTIMEQPIIDMESIINETLNRENCTCDMANFNISTQSRMGISHSDMVNGGIGGSQIERFNGGFNVSSYLLCQDSVGKWPTVSAMTSFYEPDEAFGVLIYNLNPNSLDGDFFNATMLGEAVTTNITNESLFTLSSQTISTVIEHNNYFVNSTYVFPDVVSDYFIISALNYEFMDDFEKLSSVAVARMHRRKLLDVSQTIDFTFPNTTISEIASIFNDDIIRYDFSNSGLYDYVKFKFNYSTEIGRSINWELYTSTTEELPNFENIYLSDFISSAEMESIQISDRISINLIGYQDIGSYQEYLKLRSSESEDYTINSKWGNIYNVALFATLSE